LKCQRILVAVYVLYTTVYIYKGFDSINFSILKNVYIHVFRKNQKVIVLVFGDHLNRKLKCQRILVAVYVLYTTVYIYKGFDSINFSILKNVYIHVFRKIQNVILSKINN